MRLDINTNEAIKLTAKLERLHRSALPSAIRNTLNQSGFDMKRKMIPQSFKQNFKPKSGTLPYVKKLLKVEKASGFNVKNMSAQVGFLNSSDKWDKRFVEGLVKQESGGVINDGLRYLKDARGGKIKGKVQSANYYDKEKVISEKSTRKGTKRSKFVARAYRAMKDNEPLFMSSIKGNFLVKIKNMSSNMQSKKLEFDFEFIAMGRRVKKTNLKPSFFVEEAGRKAKKEIESNYFKQAEFQIKKYIK